MKALFCRLVLSPSWRGCGVGLVLLFTFVWRAGAVQVTDGRLTATMYSSGSYFVASSVTGWTFSGSLPNRPTQLASTSGSDSIGVYQQISFSWLDTSGRQMTGLINLYNNQDVLVFSDTLVAASATAPSPFPNFSSVPTGLSFFSYNYNAQNYQSGDFTPPTFSLPNAPTPWVLFDSSARTAIISPASHCLPAQMIGDGRFQIASGFNSTLANVIAGYTQKTVLAISSGINHTFNAWGLAMTNLYGKARPAYDADTLLRYYGIWTDNGASYYYNYNTSATSAGANAYESPYEATLQSLVANFTQASIPVHYLQLDSWWYDKSDVSYDGSNAGTYRGSLNQPWAYFGGALSWAGDGYNFPANGSTSGVLAFSQSLAMPFVCHARWIDTSYTPAQNGTASDPFTFSTPSTSSLGDPTFYSQFGGLGSPNFTGIVGISATFWNTLAAYAKANNIQVYEQDWLEEMIKYSPGLLSTPDQGDSFLGNMAGSFASQGVNIQYCIPLTSCILQASQYANVTTARASGDRFQSSRYHDFLYASRFDIALGIWPWVDVFMSTETPNLLLAVLSAGPVGTGDAMGSESTTNLLLAMRGDGVLVKPDLPLVPTDSAYIAEAAGTGVPLVCSTSTSNGVTTTYAVAIPQSSSSNTTYSLSPSDLGVTTPAYFYNYFTGSATKVTSGQTVTGQIPTTGSAAGVAYYVIAPVGQSGIAFLGDMGKLAANGRKRIASVTDQPGQFTADLRFAAADAPVVLHGCAAFPPAVTVQSGAASAVSYDTASGHFTVTITPSSSAALTTTATDQDPARDVVVTFAAAAPAHSAKQAPRERLHDH